MDATTSSRFTLEQLSELSQLPARTIRFYIQMELVPRPNGSRRGAWYDERHLSALLRIRSLTQKGLSLEAVRRALLPGEDERLADEEAAAPTVTTRTHVRVAPGLELVLDPLRAPLSPPALRRFIAAASAAFQEAQDFDSAATSHPV